MIGIYKIENLINGKVYIGQSVNIEERWQTHKHINLKTSEDALKKQKYPLYLAFKKYGIENFSFEVLEECKEGELDEKEKYYIEKYNSYVEWDNSNGYNLTIGGNGLRKISEKIFKKVINLWNEGKTIGEIEEKTKICKETIRKFLLTNCKNYTSEESLLRAQKKTLEKVAKKVDCYDIYGNFLFTCDSIREASKKCHVDRNMIAKICEGKSPRVQEYRFTYEKPKKEILFEGKFSRDFIVILERNGEIKYFPSITHAGNFLRSDPKEVKRLFQKGQQLNGWNITIKHF